MEKAIISGHEYVTFDTSPTFPKVEAVVFNATKVTKEQVAALPGFYLNPFVKPNQLELPAIKCSFIDYINYCATMLSTKATEAAVKEYGMSWEDEEVNRQREEFEDNWITNFTPYYHAQ